MYNRAQAMLKFTLPILCKETLNRDKQYSALQPNGENYRTHLHCVRSGFKLYSLSHSDQAYFLKCTLCHKNKTGVVQL